MALLAGQSRQQKPNLGKRASKGHYCVAEGELPGVAELICWALLQVLPRGKAKKSATHPRHPLAGRSRRHAHPAVLGRVHTGTEPHGNPRATPRELSCDNTEELSPSDLVAHSVSPFILQTGPVQLQHE